ncbi:MAG: ABC-type enterobactin transport system, permease component, partial [Microbacterium sp.]|nr:ABC-type enterobactin transport system, permease component [Microbacterium sp.]
MTAVEVGYRRVLLGGLPVRIRSIAVGAAVLAAVVVLSVFSLGWGTYPVAPDAVVRALLGAGSALDTTVV